MFIFFGIGNTFIFHSLSSMWGHIKKPFIYVPCLMEFSPSSPMSSEYLSRSSFIFHVLLILAIQITLLYLYLYCAFLHLDKFVLFTKIYLCFVICVVLTHCVNFVVVVLRHYGLFLSRNSLLIGLGTSGAIGDQTQANCKQTKHSSHCVVSPTCKISFINTRGQFNSFTT